MVAVLLRRVIVSDRETVGEVRERRRGRLTIDGDDSRPTDRDDAADALAIAICHAHHRQSVTGRLAAALAG